jgi:hypothetical protein
MEGAPSGRCIFVTVRIVKKRFGPNRSIPTVVFVIAEEGERSDSRVVGADGIAKKRPVTNGRIGEAFGVTKQSKRSIGRISNCGAVT